MSTPYRTSLLLLAVVAASWAQAAEDPPPAKTLAKLEEEGRKRLEADLAKAKRLRRPEWLNNTPLEVKLTTDYKKMRRAVDSRFNKGKSREAVKILYELIDRGSGKPRNWAEWYLAQGLIWAKETAFGMLEYKKADPTPDALLSLGRCYLEYDQFKVAADIFQKARAVALSSRLKNKNLLEARAWWALADVRRQCGDFAEAKPAYRKAYGAFERESQVKGKPGWFIANMKKQMGRMRFMMDLCDAGSLEVADLKAGAYAGQVEGFDGPIAVRVTIAGGRIAKIEVTSHKESIPLDALTEIPRRIIESQTPSVDSITGATVTAIGVMGAVLKALNQAK